MKTKYLFVLMATMTLASCGNNATSSESSAAATTQDASSQAASSQAGTTSGAGTTSQAGTTSEEASSEEKPTPAKVLYNAFQSIPEKKGLGAELNINGKVNVASYGEVSVKNLKLGLEGFRDTTKEDVVVVPAQEGEGSEEGTPAKTMPYYTGHAYLNLDGAQGFFYDKETGEQSDPITVQAQALDVYLDGGNVYADASNIKFDNIIDVLNIFKDNESIAKAIPMVQMIDGVLGTYDYKLNLSVEILASLISGFSQDGFDFSSVITAYDSAMTAIKSVQADQIDSIFTLVGDYINFTENGDGYIATLNVNYDSVVFFINMISAFTSQEPVTVTKEEAQKYLPGLDEENSKISFSFDGNGIGGLNVALKTGVAINVTIPDQDPKMVKVADIDLKIGATFREVTSYQLPDVSGYTDPTLPPEESSEEVSG